jgi:DNA-binding TFAR19-related protein (PDSD5 family)
MTRICCVTLATLGLLLTNSASAQRGGSATRDDRMQARVTASVAGLKSDLRDARRLLADIDDRQLREQLELLLSRAALKAEDLEELLGGAPRGRVQLPISDADFAKLIENIKEQSFDEQKLEFVKTFAKGRPLNCDQVTRLLKTFSFDDDRIAAAVILYPGLVDSENFFEVLKIFPFDSSRKQVMEAIRKK